MSPAQAQKQHGEHPARKIWLRRAVIAEIGDEAAYVPFIGDGDIAAACYSERVIYGVDLDPARVAVAQIALPTATVIVGDCNEGWPHGGVEDTFALCDADAYAYPYGAIRAFWEHARKADAVGLLGTDAQMQMYMRNASDYYGRDPSGARCPCGILGKVGKTKYYVRYWTQVVKPWLSALVEADGYTITTTKHFERAKMHYWGAVAKR